MHYNNYARLDPKTKEVIPCTFEEYVQAFEPDKFESNKRVARDYINGNTISTVFLALNHGFSGEGLWFETMIFPDSKGGIKELEGYQTRCSTYAQAVAMHKEAVELVRSKSKWWRRLLRFILRFKA